MASLPPLPRELRLVVDALSRAAAKPTTESLVLAFVVAVGVLVVLNAVLTLLSAIWRIFLRPGKNLRRYGEWAVVTGCTDGIGKAFCEELAKKKIKVFLISRTEAKLKELAAELKSKYKAETNYAVVDFAEAGDDEYAAVAKKLSKLDIGLLINNVGMSYSHAMYLHELSAEEVEAMLAINCRSTVRMCQAVLPGMLSRRRGAILNIGSAAATVLPADPLYSVYAATKGFVDQLSRTLRTEVADRGVHVQLQAPLYVATKMSKIRRASLTVPTPRAYAKAGLAAIGYEARVTPFWAHALMWGAIAAVPEWLMDSIRLRQCKSLRARALKKLGKSA